VLQYLVVCDSVLQCVVIELTFANVSLATYYGAVCCSVLQCVAVCCSVLQCVLAELTFQS